MYNQAIFFIGRCLTLGTYPERIEEVKQIIKSDDFSWESAVFAASNQYVLTSWFIQMHKTGLLEKMPVELVQHIEEITNLNRERNRQILNQTIKISTLLNKHGIAPVFLKGTAHLLLGLYSDPAERMIGDIDILVNDNELIKAAELIKTFGFQPHEEYIAALHYEMKHYPAMVNSDYPAAVEIHREILNSPYEKNFRADNIIKTKQQVKGFDGVYVPGNKELIFHNMINAQINDRNYSNARVLLRQTYDLFLLANKENPLKVLEDFGKFKKESHAWLATSAALLGNPENIKIKNTFAVKRYVSWFIFLQKHRHISVIHKHYQYFLMRLKRYISLPVTALTNPVIRSGIKARLTSKSWYRKQIDSYKKYFKNGI
jgi:hypothetical protein